MSPRANALLVLAMALLTGPVVRSGWANQQKPMPQEPNSPATAQRLENFFQWGEYDSVLAIGIPWIPSHGSGLDLKSLAKCHLFLGIAYFAKERIAASREEIALSYKLDPTLTLDPLYATPAILKHYQSVVESERLPQPLDSSLATGIELVAPKALDPVAPKDPDFRVGPWFLPKVLFGVSALAGGLVVYQFGQAEEAYRRFRQAALVTGDPAEYASRREDVHRADRWMLAWTMASASGFMGGAYFAYRAYVRLWDGNGKGFALRGLGVGLSPQGARAVMAWGF